MTCTQSLVSFVSQQNASQLTLPHILPDQKSGLSSWKGDSWQLDSTERTKYSVQFDMPRSSEQLVNVDLSANI